MNCRPSQPRSITASDLKNILTEKEALRVEFKLEYDVSPGQGAERKRGEFAKDIMALANTAGRHADDFAYLVIGAGDKLQADGTRPRKSIEPDQYSGKSLLAIVNGPCAPELRELIVTEVHLDGTLYGVITLPPSPHVHHFSKDVPVEKGVWRKNTIPLRSGEEIIVASQDDIRLMEKQKAAWSLSASQESFKLLKLLPLPNQNFVRLGETKYTENARFSFTVWFNILSQEHASILTGFRADYIAPDGCYCANQDFEIQVGGKSISTSGNDLNFTDPIPIAAGAMIQLAYRRFVLPPLPVQVPADCDYGDVRVKSSFYSQSAEKTVFSYFRFEVGGDLVEIDQPREPPILSDSVLRAMLDHGLITQEEHQRAKVVGPVARYHILRFPQFRKQVYPQGPTTAMDITPDSYPTPQFRAFLKEIHERQLHGATDPR